MREIIYFPHYLVLLKLGSNLEIYPVEYNFPHYLVLLKHKFLYNWVF